MSWCNRRTFLIGAVALGGCGFTPAYGPSGGAAGLLGRVEIEEPGDHYGYVLVRELEDRLGRTSSGKYYLSLSTTVERQEMAVTIGGLTNRFDLLGEATYALMDKNTKEVLTTGKVDNFTGYSTTGTTVATLAGETDAEERLMIMLADQIHAQLLAFAKTNPL
ncbi:LPS assembly lipoprotein LptE [Shimia biformata]|uniref:LPS assembly lipoprotein LptE n=1 Tax=Shimia biformata TaxID=1294299 RepID=UPI001950288B|nr:LPS assembly lipoprotein LptE [Shimia biformata]